MFKLLLLLLLSSTAWAANVTLPTTYQNGGTVTASNLNGNFTAITAQVNGGLDNDNANSAGGYRFFETKSSLPSNGTQGRVVFLTSNNTLNFDNGSTWQTTVTPTGTPSTGYLPYYNSGWTLLAPGSQYYSLVSNGASSLPSYQQVGLTTGVTGTLPLANGGTGQTSAANAINALLPSQVGNSGKNLTTDGSVASWGAGSGLTLISNTAVSGAADTGDIAFTSTNYYKVIVHLGGGWGTGAPALHMRINNSSGASYAYVYNGRTESGAITGGSAGVLGTEIVLGTAVQSPSFVNMEFIIYPASGNVIHVKGDMSYQNSAGPLLTDLTFMGYSQVATPVSFRIYTSTGTTITSGNVLLYKLNTT